MLVIKSKQKVAKRQKIKYIIFSSIILGFILFIGRGLAVEYTLDNLDEVETWQINQDINEKRSQIEDLKKQVDVYKKNIAVKQAEISNLSNQISILNSNIGKINLEIKAAELEIETLNLKIENTQLKIQAKEKEITEQKANVAEILRRLHQEQQQNSVLEILVLNDNFSDFVAELDRLEKIQDGIVKEVNDLKNIKLAMIQDINDLEQNKTEIDTLKGLLDNKKSDLGEQKVAKASLVKLTQGQEAKFQQMLAAAKAEQEQINSDIVYLEKIAREKLNRQLQQQQESDGQGLVWPVSSRTITAYFHDPEYPYRYIFEHPAIDIATAQGTAIKAVESGYVAKIKDGGKTGYSYIMIVHADGLASVYGHVNQINISQDQFVSRGQVIAYSGGMPGTRGAGPFSTGPHVHLEIRLNGVPVNPLNYLP